MAHDEFKWILIGLLVGVAAGSGFADFESAGYIFTALFRGLAVDDGGPEQFYGTLFVRK